MSNPLDSFDRVSVEFFRTWIEQEVRLIRAGKTRAEIDLARYHWNAAAMMVCRLLIDTGAATVGTLSELMANVGMQLAVDGKWPEVSELCKFSSIDPARG